MATTSIRNKAGFTLIEVMVAILIMMVGMLGLLASVDIATEVNLKNHIRDEAVYIGEKYMNIQRGKPFDKLSTSYGPRYEPSRIRAANKSYTIDMTTGDLSTNATTPSKRVRVVVKWTYKGVEYQNELTSPISVIQE